MGRIEKTVFISYRRTNLPWALAIYQNLTTNGYDVFFDFESIASGDFEQVILGNIRARAHFLVVLTPSALERCDNPNDWLRREIETALLEKRNIVPLFVEGFEISSPSITKHLTGKLVELKKYNGLTVPASFFNEAMSRVRERFLNVALDTVLHPVSEAVSNAVSQQQIAADNAPEIPIRELTAQEWFEKGHNATNLDEIINCYTEAIRLNPDFAEAYNSRGDARKKKGDRDGAIVDYTETIRLKPNYAEVYNNLGLARKNTTALRNMILLLQTPTFDLDDSMILTGPGVFSIILYLGVMIFNKDDLNSAVQNFTEAIRLNPDYAEAYYNRGLIYHSKGELDRAIKDYTEAIRLKANLAEAYHYRGFVHYRKRELDDAIKDYTEAIRLKPDFAEAYHYRGNTWCAKKDFYSAVGDYQKCLDVSGNNEIVSTCLKQAKKKISK